MCGTKIQTATQCAAGCSVPSVLKSELLAALSSLSKSPEVALDVWNGLEASNFIAVAAQSMDIFCHFASLDCFKENT